MSDDEKNEILADLYELMREVGLPQVARPQSPREVFQECLGRLRDQRRLREAHMETIQLNAARLVYVLAGGVEGDPRQGQKVSRIQIAIRDGRQGVLTFTDF